MAYPARDGTVQRWENTAAPSMIRVVKNCYDRSLFLLILFPYMLENKCWKWLGAGNEALKEMLYYMLDVLSLLGYNTSILVIYALRTVGT